MLIPILLLALLTAPEPGQAGVEDLAEVLHALPAKFSVPAIGCALIREGRLSGLGVAGVRKRDSKVAVTKRDQWHIGSCTKAMTATLVARLVERGDLAWNTTLGAAFPKIEVHERLVKVTLPLVLGHRAGLMRDPSIGDLWSRMRKVGSDVRDVRMLVARRVLSRPPLFEPGKRMLYSNTGYIIVGALIESVTRDTWESAMRRLVFAPLGMKSAGFGPPGTAGELDQPRGHNPAGRPFEPGPRADNPAAYGPAGTVHLTLADWAKFIIVHLSETAPDETSEKAEKADKPFLRAATLALLHTPVGKKGNYALGWGITKRKWAGGRTLTHNGTNLKWFAVCWLAPRKKLALLATCNQGGVHGQRACDAACAAMLKHLAPPQK